MDTEYTAPNGELREAYNAVINSGAGREAANNICIAHGATPGMHAWRRVEPSKAKACLAALEKLAGSQPKRAAAPAPAPTRMDQVRRQSFANIGTEERKPAPAAKRLDPDAIYSRWNNPPPVEE